MYQKPDEKFPGAYVANPLHVNNYSRMMVNGRYVNIFNNVIDFDFSAQYPNAAIQNNMAPYTQIGRIVIDNVIWPGENPFNKPNYNRGGQFLEDYMTRDCLS